MQALQLYTFTTRLPFFQINTISNNPSNAYSTIVLVSTRESFIEFAYLYVVELNSNRLCDNVELLFSKLLRFIALHLIQLTKSNFIIAVLLFFPDIVYISQTNGLVSSYWTAIREDILYMVNKYTCIKKLFLKQLFFLHLYYKSQATHFR